MMSDNNRAPNFFWPVILVSAGVIMLLSNLEIYEFEILDLMSLVQLWPLLLVAMGVNLLFGKTRSWLGSLFSLVLGLAVVAFFLLAPDYIEPVSSADFVTESFTEALDEAESARVTVDFDRGTLEVFPLTDSPNLAEVEVTHNQDLDFRTSGGTQRNVTVNLDSGTTFGFIDFLEEQQIVGEIGLSPDLPIELTVDVGGGNAVLDLEGMSLTDLDVNSGSGSIELVHPVGNFRAVLGAGSGSIEVQTRAGSELDLKAEVGSGRIRLTIAEDVYGEVDLQSGSGGITVYVPEGAAVLVTGTTGSGSVHVPNDFDRVSGSGSLSGDSGTWRSPGFEDAEFQLVIEFSIGSGSFRVVYD
jgi:hypothetical protein